MVGTIRFLVLRVCRRRSYGGVPLFFASFLKKEDAIIKLVITQKWPKRFI